MSESARTVWTVGHSTRSLEEFVEVLRAYEVEAIVDVRRFAGSRRLPQFGAEALRDGLALHGIDYCAIETLGGRRKVDPQSPNDGWHNVSFRGYADYTASESFAAGVDELLAITANQRSAMMCAEVLWWRCHRSLIADVLARRGIEVRHILDATHCSAHPYTSPARLIDGQLSYAAEGGELLNERARKKARTNPINGGEPDTTARN